MPSSLFPEKAHCLERSAYTDISASMFSWIPAVMIQRRRQEHSEKSAADWQNNAHKQHHIIADVLKDHTKAESGKDSDLPGLNTWRVSVFFRKNPFAGI